MSQQINLFNPAFRKQREWFAASMVVPALAALVLIMVVVYGYQYRQVMLLDKQIKTGATSLAQEPPSRCRPIPRSRRCKRHAEKNRAKLSHASVLTQVKIRCKSSDYSVVAK